MNGRRQKSEIFGLILAGGSGTRLWPLSRELNPKQILRLTGKESLIQQTIKRIKKITPEKNIFISTNASQAEEIKIHLLNRSGLPKNNFIIEPLAKNTAPAIGLAAALFQRKNPEAIMVVAPADHFIKKEASFVRNLKNAIKTARTGYLVTLGIPPNRPSLDYGYIKIKKGGRNVSKSVERFVEKPTVAVAQNYLREGGYFWNSGIFIWPVSIILEEIKRHLPNLYQGLNKISDFNNQPQLEKVFNGLEAISIDYGVLEKSNRIKLVPAEFQWSDIGNWQSLYEILPKNKDGNVADQNALLLDCKNSLVLGSPRRTIAGINLDNIIVADTEDALLVCHQNHVHKIKEVFKKLKESSHPAVKFAKTVERPWGKWLVIEEGPGYKIKKITLNPAGRLSLQKHHQRSEHWIVVSGLAKITTNERVFYLNPHETITIPKDVIHRLENPGKKPAEIIEIQSGEYMGEDDIVRFDDQYGRSA